MMRTPRRMRLVADEVPWGMSFPKVVRKVAEKFGVSPDTVQRVSRLFEVAASA